MPTTISITFKGGIGSVTAKLFRKGKEIDNGSADKSGVITLKDSEKDDAISINGISPPHGTDVSISVPTDPSTNPPVSCKAGPIFIDFDVL